MNAVNVIARSASAVIRGAEWFVRKVDYGR